MNKYEKLATFLARLVCVLLLAWSVFRLVLFLYTAAITKGFQHGTGWPLLFQSLLPGLMAFVLHLATPQIVSYLSRDLGD